MTGDASSAAPVPAPPPGPAPARPAATLVLLRPPLDGRGGLEVLLTKRPDSMRFGPGMHVFPGGRLEAGESNAGAAVRETAEETGIEVDPGSLIPLTRWVTPYGLPARFDTRFFAAVVPEGTDVRHASDEVAAWSWLRPTDALEGLAAGRLAMWQPTVVTLQQLEPLAAASDLRAAFSGGPGRRHWEPPLDTALARRVETTWAAGIEGRHGTTLAVGRSEWLVVDPPDPTDETVAALLATAAGAGAVLAGVVIDSLEPEAHAGVELFARGLGLPVAGPPGANALAPYDLIELNAGALVPFGDSGLRVAAVEAPRTDGTWAGRAARLRLEGR